MIKILEYTKDPLQIMGEYAGKCYGTTNPKFFKKIAEQCLRENHGRVQEFVSIGFEYSGYSAKVIRELLRHIHLSGLQASTRYIDYTKQFDYLLPPSIAKNDDTKEIFENCMNNISETMNKLKDAGVPVEDFSNVLPLAYNTNGVFKIGLRELIHMFGVRACTCAYHEARKFMADLKKAIIELGDEQWTWIAENYFVPKCERLLYCEEEKRWAGCKRKPKKSQVEKWIAEKMATENWREE